MAWYELYGLISIIGLIGIPLLLWYENKKYPVHECENCHIADNLVTLDSGGATLCWDCRSSP